MRNPLNLAFLKHDGGPSLRERLTATSARLRATRERAAVALKVSREAIRPPEPETADRIALVNYATWLWHERKRVCAELYPHRGCAFDSFVMGLNAAEDWHYEGRDRSGGWAEKPPARDRAIQILDLMGVDWRADLTESGIAHLDPQRRIDRDEAPNVPVGWPDTTTVLRTAVVDLRRLDGAMDALLSHLPAGRRVETLPGYADLVQARDRVIATITGTKAEDLTGLQAKAQALLADSIEADPDAGQDIAHSLAKDLGQGRQSTLFPQPDPVLKALTELARLEAESDALFALGNDGDATPEQEASVGRVEDYWSKIVLQTVPTTARGCTALAKAARAHCKRWGISFDCYGAPVLDLIARSPLL